MDHDSFFELRAAAFRVSDAYVREIRDALSSLEPAQRHEIIEQLLTHFEERIDSADDPLRAAHGTIAAMGSPREYAFHFLPNNRREASPGRRAFIKGGRIIAVAALSMIVLVTAVKPFWPSRVGLWINLPAHVFALGYRVPGEAPAREILGAGLFPLGFTACVGLFFLLGGHRRWRTYRINFTQALMGRTPHVTRTADADVASGTDPAMARALELLRQAISSKR